MFFTLRIWWFSCSIIVSDLNFAYSKFCEKMQFAKNAKLKTQREPNHLYSTHTFYTCFCYPWTKTGFFFFEGFFCSFSCMSISKWPKSGVFRGGRGVVIRGAWINLSHLLNKGGMCDLISKILNRFRNQMFIIYYIRLSSDNPDFHLKSWFWENSLS